MLGEELENLRIAKERDSFGSHQHNEE